jgi:hypothetical protein
MATATSTRVLVSGDAGHVAEVAHELRGRDVEVTEVIDLADLPKIAATAGADAFGAYVQLPANFRVDGETAISRVHHFYAEGVLARFRALEAALPSLQPDARVVFVMGQLPRDAATSDDRDARRALVRVLARAARADAGDSRVNVRVMEAGASSGQVAAAALGSTDEGRRDPPGEADRLSYADWRVELMGLAVVET